MCVFTFLDAVQQGGRTYEQYQGILEGEGDVIFIQYSFVLKEISICRFVLYCDKLDLIENCYFFDSAFKSCIFYDLNKI